MTAVSFSHLSPGEPGRYQRLDLFIKVLRVLCLNLTDASPAGRTQDVENEEVKQAASSTAVHEEKERALTNSTAVFIVMPPSLCLLWLQACVHRPKPRRTKMTTVFPYVRHFVSSLKDSRGEHKKNDWLLSRLLSFAFSLLLSSLRRALR